MKKLKTLTALTTLGVAFIPLSSCGNKSTTKEVVVRFTASEGIVLEGQLSITIPKDSTWNYIINHGLVPQATVPENYTQFGWCYLSPEGEWQKITESDVISDDITISFVGFSNVKHPPITIKLTADSAIPPYNYPFASGFTFEQFRWYYDIPAEPTREGYGFDGFYKSVASSNKLVPLYDYDVMDSSTTDIHLKWTINQFTATPTTDGHGTVTPSTLKFDYGTTWGAIQSKFTVTATEPTVYKFDKWVDEQGQELTASTVVTQDIKPKACFVPIVYHTVKFTKTAGVKEFSPTTLQVVDQTKWKDISGKPTAEPEENYSILGWMGIYPSGQYDWISDNSVIDSDFEARCIALNTTGGLWNVNFRLKPGKDVPYETLYAIKNATFGQFRTLYGIPATPVYEGYVFQGYYYNDPIAGWRQIDDNFIFEDNGTIEARYSHETRDITLKSGAHGSVNPSVVSATVGQTFGEAMKNVQISPDDGFQFYRWVDDNNKPISNDLKITENFTATATFKEGVTIRALEGTIRAKDYYGDEHLEKDVPYSETVSGWDGGKGRWNRPTFDNHILKFNGSKWNDDLRLISENIQIVQAVPAHTAKKWKLHLKGFWKVEVHNHPLKCHIRTTVQIFNLNGINDHPDTYANLNNKDDQRAVDPKTIYKEGFQKDHYSLVSNWSHTRNIDEDVSYVFDDSNPTDEVKVCTHYICISYLVNGWDVIETADEMANFEYQISVSDANNE